MKHTEQIEFRHQGVWGWGPGGYREGNSSNEWICSVKEVWNGEKHRHAWRGWWRKRGRGLRKQMFTHFRFKLKTSFSKADTAETTVNRKCNISCLPYTARALSSNTGAVVAGQPSDTFMHQMWQLIYNCKEHNLMKCETVFVKINSNSRAEEPRKGQDI